MGVKLAYLYSTVLYCETGTKIDVFYYDALFCYDGTYYLQDDVSFYLYDKFQIHLRLQDDILKYLKVTSLFYLGDRYRTAIV